MRQWEYKLSLFADNILLTLMNPIISLPSLHSLLHTIGSISGFKINTVKTEALPLHISPDTLTQTFKVYTLQMVFGYPAYLLLR